MKIAELKKQLNQHPDATIRFLLPTSEFVPAHAHVTEVARIDKRFVDCGGTVRTESLCRLQTWFSDDTDHRLKAGKLAKILDKAAPLLASEELEVDVEHEIGFITQLPLIAIESSPVEIVFRLSQRHTGCLAEDKCKSPNVSPPDFSPLKFNFRESPAAGCCTKNAAE